MKTQKVRTKPFGILREKYLNPLTTVREMMLHARILALQRNTEVLILDKCACGAHTEGSIMQYWWDGAKGQLSSWFCTLTTVDKIYNSTQRKSLAVMFDSQFCKAGTCKNHLCRLHGQTHLKLNIWSFQKIREHSTSTFSLIRAIP